MSVAAADWTRRAELGSAWSLSLMRWLSLRLGRRVSRWVLPFIVAYFYVAAPQARRASRAYLARALSGRPGARDVLRHFHAFASTVHDRAYLLNDRFDLFRIEIVDADVVDAALAEGHGAFLVGAHFGSFEVLRAVTRSAAAQGRRYDVTMAMYADNARRINAALARLAPQVRSPIIALGQADAMLQVQQTLDEGGLVGFLADRAVGESGTIEAPFLGSPAPFPLGAFRLAAVLRRPVLFMEGVYLGGNCYRVRFASLADFSRTARAERDDAVRRAVQTYAAALDAACRDNPYNWFNFYDFWRAA
jgi:predicted LPLAT superfamily acyltransferase